MAAAVVNLHELEAQLARLIERAHAGEEIVVAKGGEPYVRLMPVAVVAPARRREFGFLAGAESSTEEDWKALFEPMSDAELADWEGGPDFPTEGSLT